MQIRLKGTGIPELDGEYELEPEPTTREATRFRKELGLTPSEMFEILSGEGSVEIVPFYIYTALNRLGRTDDAVKILDLSLGALGDDNLELIEREDAPAPVGAEEEQRELPPA